MLQNFTDPKGPRQSLDPAVLGRARHVTQNGIYAVAGSDWTHYGTNPNSSNELLFENETFKF
jgi:hypothetical protein